MSRAKSREKRKWREGSRLPGRFSVLARPGGLKRRRRRRRRCPVNSRMRRVSSDPRPRISPRPVSRWSFYERSVSRYAWSRSRRASTSSLTRSTILEDIGSVNSETSSNNRLVVRTIPFPTLPFPSLPSIDHGSIGNRVTIHHLRAWPHTNTWHHLSS